MNATTNGQSRTIIPKRRKRHYSYDEGVDETSKLIQDEPVEIEKEIPAEESRPIERPEESKDEDSAFEE